jgi:hypothetical protein
MKMDRFSIEELNLMCIYDTGTRSGLIAGLEKITLELTAPEDGELSELVQNALNKLAAMTDGELILIHDNKEEDD